LPDAERTANSVPPAKRDQTPAWGPSGQGQGSQTSAAYLFAERPLFAATGGKDAISMSPSKNVSALSIPSRTEGGARAFCPLPKGCWSTIPRTAAGYLCPCATRSRAQGQGRGLRPHPAGALPLHPARFGAKAGESLLKGISDTLLFSTAQVEKIQ